MACNKSKQNSKEVRVPIYPAPRVVELNIREGYPIHPFTGDRIWPLINSHGDTVMTGIPHRITGRTIDPGSIRKPLAIPVGKPKIVPAHQNVKKIPPELKTNPVHITDLLKTDPGAELASTFQLRNSTGQILATGVPIPGKGKVVPCSYPQAFPTKPPGMKDNASMDIKYLDVYHGMISSQVISILEDRQGQIWLGTTGGGVSMYNGHNLTHFTAKEGLSSSWITCMLEDRRGRLWFGTLGEGVIMFDGEAFTHYTEKEGLSDNTLESILEDSKGNLWFGTTTGGASKFDGEAFTHFTIKEGLSSNWIQCMYEDSKANLWFGTGNGLNMYNGERFLLYSDNKYQAPLPVSSILEDSQGNLWFGTNGAGAIQMKDNSFTQYSEDEGLSSNVVESLIEDKQGILWIGTAGGGVNRYKEGTFTHITEDQGLSGNWVISILEDSHGSLWFGTIGGGLSIYKGHSFIQYTENEGLSSRAVLSVLEDSKGNLWFGTMFGGVCMYDGESFLQYSVNEGLGSNTIESILEDSQGNFWFGTGGGGVSKFNGHAFTNFTEKEGFSRHSIGSILEDRMGNIWFGSYGGGIIKYHDEIFTHYSELEGFCNNRVESMMEDSEGNVWFGTLGGLSMYDGERFTHYSEREGLSSNLIGSMAEDSKGRLWFGTMTAGASMFDGKSFMHFTEKEGLSNKHVQSILEDRDGNIWLSTEQGLNMIRFANRDAAIELYSYDLQDGLKGMHFLQNSVALDKNQRMWWGSNKSLTMLDLKDFLLSSLPPVVHINRIDVNGLFYDFRNPDTVAGSNMKFSNVVSFSNYPINLELPYNLNHLSFHFSGIDWSAPQKIRYSYKMEGINEDWSQLNSEAKAEYRNLSHGTYTFKIQALGEANIWSEAIAYTFTIRPPWWYSWWAICSYGLMAIGLMFSIIQWRTKRLLRRQKELESTVQERTIEISEKNEELNMQNDHLASQRDEIQEQKDRIEKQKLALTDSIEYAKRIQTATLPPDELMKVLLPKHFVLYRPLDIVSGDFYWLTQKDGKIVIAVADCTGHGVPGAFMSMLGSALLNDIVNNMSHLQANFILNELRDQVIASLRQTGKTDEARDGMDIALCILDREQKTLQYAGAHQPLYHLRNNELTVIKADMMPIGISNEAGRSFTNHELILWKDDAIYMCSDGYVDQLGGAKRKRFRTSRFKELLLEVQNRVMFDQKEILTSALNDWMGLTGLYDKEYEQIDDVIVMGIRI